jgi:hypothetical protein
MTSSAEAAVEFYVCVCLCVFSFTCGVFDFLVDTLVRFLVDINFLLLTCSLAVMHPLPCTGEGCILLLPWCNNAQANSPLRSMLGPFECV